MSLLTLRNLPRTNFFGHHMSIFQLPLRTSPNAHVHISHQPPYDAAPTGEYLGNLPVYHHPEARPRTSTPRISFLSVSDSIQFSAPIWGRSRYLAAQLNRRMTAAPPTIGPRSSKKFPMSTAILALDP